MKISTISSIENNKIFCEKFFKDSSPFISYDFFKYLEKTGCTNSDTGWEPEHIIVESNKKIIGFIPNFRKKNSNGEYPTNLAIASKNTTDLKSSLIELQPNIQTCMEVLLSAYKNELFLTCDEFTDLKFQIGMASTNCKHTKSSKHHAY